MERFYGPIAAFKGYAARFLARALGGLRNPAAPPTTIVVVASAHPVKFEQIVEPLVGHAVEPPPALAASLANPAHAQPFPVDSTAFAKFLRAGIS